MDKIYYFLREYGNKQFFKLQSNLLIHWIKVLSLMVKAENSSQEI